jgi:hypothetical protein
MLGDRNPALDPSRLDCGSHHHSGGHVEPSPKAQERLLDGFQDAIMETRAIHPSEEYVGVGWGLRGQRWADNGFWEGTANIFDIKTATVGLVAIM